MKVGADEAFKGMSGDKERGHESEALQKQRGLQNRFKGLLSRWQLRREAWELMNKIEESPKKALSAAHVKAEKEARGAFEKSALAEVISVPPGAASDDWVPASNLMKPDKS